jgi:hypothetical protein
MATRSIREHFGYRARNSFGVRSIPIVWAKVSPNFRKYDESRSTGRGAVDQVERRLDVASLVGTRIHLEHSYVKW